MTELQRQLLTLIFKDKMKAIELLKSYRQQNTPIDVNFTFNLPSKDLRGTTPLMAACSLGAYDLVRELINNGAVLDAKDLEIKNALHYAVTGKNGDIQERERIISLLIYLKKDLLTSGDCFGDTPLHKVALQGTPAIAKLLLDYDKKLAYLTNEDGETPLMVAMAREFKDEEIIMVLNNNKNLDKIPSLTYLCLKKIAQSAKLRSQIEEVLPETLQEETYLYTPGLVKYLYQMKNPVETENIISEKLANLKIST